MIIKILLQQKILFLTIKKLVHLQVLLLGGMEHVIKKGAK